MTSRAAELPPPATTQIDFARDVQPIFERACIKCHGAERPKSRFSLVSREAALRGGDNGVAIIPGDSARSPLIQMVAGLVEDMEMPPKGKGDPLTAQEISLLRAWIDQGAKWSDEAPKPGLEMFFAPRIGWTAVSGNKSVFREHYWMREEWNDGVEKFELNQRLDDRSRLSVEGHALQDDFRVSLTLERTDLGFVRGGFEQYRKFYADTGGHFPAFDPEVFRLGRDPELDHGRVWADVGLTLPHWPRMVLGYEYRYRDGEKSTLQWGAITQGGETRNVYPAFKEIDEQVHIVKFDLDYEIGGFRIEDTFRAEFLDLSTSRTNRLLSVLTGAISSQDIREGYQDVQAANAIRIEKQVTDWFLASAGYLFSTLDGDATFNMDSAQLSGVPIYMEEWDSLDITLERDSHVFNLNAMFGPWDGLTLSAGVQNEWTQQKGFMLATQSLVNPVFPPINSRVVGASDLDKASLQELVALRYTKIPFTVLFADARLQQESIDQTEDQTGNFQTQFARDTDESSQWYDVRAGFNTSPWRPVSFQAHYRRSQRDTEYDENAIADEGYPSFIREREIEMDEIESKLILRWTGWLKTTLGYKLQATDYHTETDSLLGGYSPGGRVFAGNYDAHIWSANAVLTPWSRLYLSTTFSFTASRTSAEDNESPSVARYRGHVYSVLSSGTFAWTEKTDLTLSYGFSHADYSQSHYLDGLPLGIDYQRHAVIAGINRKFLKNITTKLQYGFFYYDEPSRGSANDYTAHALFGTIGIRLP